MCIRDRKKCCKVNILTANGSLFTLHFANDQPILAENEMDISYLLRKLVEEYIKWGLKINVSKTVKLLVGGGGKYLELGTKVMSYETSSI